MKGRPWEINRRACLRGAGAAIGLPTLEAMLPGMKRARAATPKRLVFFIFQGGTCDTKNLVSDQGKPGSLWPKTQGTDFETTELLQPFEDAGLKQDILLIERLSNSIGRNVPYSTGIPDPPHEGLDHNRSALALLTGCDPEWADGNGPTKVGISVDQAAAKALGGRAPSLVLGGPYQSDLVNGFSYSWLNPTTRNLPITTAAAFNKVFSGGDTSDPKFKKAATYRKSLLDYAKGEHARLRRKLGTSDQQRLEGYLDSVRSLESRIVAGPTSGGMCAATAAPASATTFPAQLQQMLDLVPLAFQCDATRVVVIQIHAHGMYFDWLPAALNRYADWHQDVEHGQDLAKDGYRDVGDRLEAYVTGCQWMFARFANLISQLKSTDEGDGSGKLLDNTALVCTSEISYGNGHPMYRLPVIVSGRAGGAIRTGRYFEAGGGGPDGNGPPIANLWLSLLHAVGVNASSFGNSEAPVTLG